MCIAYWAICIFLLHKVIKDRGRKYFLIIERWIILVNLDAEIEIVLNMSSRYSQSTLVQVEIPYLRKTIEVQIPNNIQEGHKVRLKGLGYSDTLGNKGDLYLIVSKIERFIEGNVGNNIESEVITMQKMVVVKYNDFCEVNNYLENGWKVKEFKPFREDCMVYVYVLLEK